METNDRRTGKTASQCLKEGRDNDVVCVCVCVASIHAERKDVCVHQKVINLWSWRNVFLCTYEYMLVRSGVTGREGVKYVCAINH